jgi:CubicO group peptidase (beta-lactamase class C family)
MLMSRRLPWLVIVALLSIVAVPVRADDVDAFVKAQMQRFKVPGLSLAVVKDGVAVKVQGYGLANVEQRTPAAPETVYKIGSVSKQFIATGIMLLAQSGRLSIDDPIGRYLEGTPSSWDVITLRHLLTHTSGIVREAPGFDPFKIQSDADVIRTAYPLPLRFEPGTKWEYCNVGYFALAEVIHKVTGQPWTEYLRTAVFEPSGMTSTRPTDAMKGVAGRAVGYAGKDNHEPAPDWPALRPSGAFLSTVRDLVKWDRQLSGDTVLSEASRRLMWTPVRLANGTSHPYGFGWELADLKGHRHVGHGGSLPGFRSGFSRYPDDRLTVIVLMNADDVDRGSVVQGIADLYLKVLEPATAR